MPHRACRPVLRRRHRWLSAEALERREVLSTVSLLATAPPLQFAEANYEPPAANTVVAATLADEGEGPAGPPSGYTTMISAGPSSNRVDIVFLGDGYRAAEIETVYVDHINSMIDHVFFQNEDPFTRYKNFFNIHRIDVVSVESGADKPPEGVFRNTALDAAYYCGGTDRLICISEFKANQALSSGLAGAPFSAEMKLVTVNDTKYGGSGGTFAVYAGGNSSAPELALHELGHSFSNLADEYEGNAGAYSGPEPVEVNVTKNSTGAKWSHWLGYVQPGIGAIGAYEGGRYFSQGIYRPSLESKMRTLNRPFDAVAREKIVLDIYRYVDPLDAWLNNSATVAGSQVWVDAVDTNVIAVEWSVDGAVVAGAGGETFDLQAYGYGPGTYSVTARAYDTTDWVRKNLHQLEQSVTWSVFVEAANGPPLAADDSAGASEDQAIDINVLLNDVDPDGVLSAAGLTITAAPANGSAVVNLSTGLIRYTPAENFFGSDAFRYTVTDERGAVSNEATVAITVASVNDPPSGIVLSPSSIAENSPGALVGSLAAIDPDLADTHAFSTDDERFEIIAGQLKLRDGVQFDHETTPAVTVNITAIDDGAPSASASFDVVVAVDNVNEPPTGIALVRVDVYEYVQQAVVGALLVADPDVGSPVYEFLLSDSRFTVAGGVLRLRPGFLLTAADDDSLLLAVTARDASDEALQVSETFTIQVLANPNPWHNWSQPLDVDGDGFVAPSDALVLINYLYTANANVILPAPPQLPAAPPPYLDVSDDRIVAPDDVLVIINFLIAVNPAPPQAEGELVFAGATPHLDLPPAALKHAPLQVERGLAGGRQISPAPQRALAAEWPVVQPSPPSPPRLPAPQRDRLDDRRMADEEAPRWDRALLEVVDEAVAGEPPFLPQRQTSRAP